MIDFYHSCQIYANCRSVLPCSSSSPHFSSGHMHLSIPHSEIPLHHQKGSGGEQIGSLEQKASLISISFPFPLLEPLILTSIGAHGAHAHAMETQLSSCQSSSQNTERGWAALPAIPHAEAKIEIDTAGDHLAKLLPIAWSSSSGLPTGRGCFRDMPSEVALIIPVLYGQRQRVILGLGGSSGGGDRGRRRGQLARKMKFASS